MVNVAIKQFYRTYASYLGGDTAKQLIQALIDQSNAIASLTECVSVVQAALRAVPKGDTEHRLAGVKGLTTVHCGPLSCTR